MELVSDASVFLAVALNEADRQWVIEKTTGGSLASPEILPYEIGNALIAVGKRGRLNNREILQAYDIAQKIAVRLLPVNIREAMETAAKFNIYAYDAYYLQCCLERGLPLISLDNRMCEIADILGIKVVS